MILLFKLGISFSLIGIFFHDFRSREVHILLFASLFLLSFSLTIYSGEHNWIDFSIKSIFVLVNLLLLMIYARLRLKSLSRLRESIGLGDIIFWLSILPFYRAQNFIILFCFSLIFSFIMHYVFLYFTMYKNRTVPLAGLQSLFWLITFWIQTISII